MHSSSQIITINKPTPCFLQARCLSCCPTVTVKALNDSTRRSATVDTGSDALVVDGDWQSWYTWQSACRDGQCVRRHVGRRLSYKSGTLSAWDTHRLWKTREGGRGGEVTRLEPRARANFLSCRYCRYCAVNKSYTSYLLPPSNEFGPPPVTTPTNSAKALKGARITFHRFALSKLTCWVLESCIWPLQAPGYLGGKAASLLSAFWSQYHTV